MTDAATPTLHLVYGDGLYTLSLFELRGQLSLEAVRHAERLLTDAPFDELLAVVADLPTEEPPSMLERLARGTARVGRWLWPMNRSEQ